MKTFFLDANSVVAKKMRFEQRGAFVLWKSLCLALLFLSVVLSSVDAQSCGLACTVQYQVSGAHLNKCGFPEYTNATFPRIHIYHHQTTTVDTYQQDDESGTSGGTVFGLNFNVYYNDGAWHQNVAQTEGIVFKEFTEPITCNYSNNCTGTFSFKEDAADGRVYFYENFTSPYSYVMSNHWETVDEEASVQYCTNCCYEHGLYGWSLQGATVDNGYDTGTAGTYSWNTTNSTGNMCIEIGYSYTIMSPVLMSYSYTDSWMDYDELGPWYPVGGTNSVGGGFEDDTASVTLDSEYSDGELYTNICGLMPAYSGIWYSGDDFWQCCAYSGIAADHCDGYGMTVSTYAELQKMKYRFDVPGSQPFTQYKITWDLVTYDTSVGLVSTVHNETNILGNGSDAYSDVYEVPAPWWSKGDFGGYQFTFVANVQVSIVSQNDASAPPGAGPGWNFVGGNNGCSSCGAAAGGNILASDGAYAAFSLGRATAYYSAGLLRICSPQPMSALSTPVALSITAASPSVEIIQASNQLRQINAPQALADVVVSNAYSYNINYYLPSQVGPLTNGTHQLSGMPFLTWQITNPDGATTNNRLRFTETIGSQTNVFECDYNAVSNSWKYEYPGGIREDEVITINTTNNLGLTTTITRVTRVPGGPDQSKIKSVYETHYPRAWDGSAPSGPYLVQQTLDPDNNPKTTTYTYNWNSFANGTTLPLDSVTRPDGSWEKHANFDAYGRPEAVYSSQQNSTLANYSSGNYTYYYYDPNAAFGYGSGDDGTMSPNTPREVDQWVNGVESLKFTMFPSYYQRLDIICEPGLGWNSPGNLVTTNNYYSTGPNTNRLQSVLHPDGTMQIYTYDQAAAGSQTNTVYSGVPNAGQTAIVDGTETITILDPAGQLVSRTQIDIASGVTTSRETYGDDDTFGRPQSVTYLDGTSNITAYACCGVDFTIDRDGVMTQYQYDAAKRQVAATRLAITTSNVLDSVGNVLQTVRIGTDNSAITLNQSGYDLAGQLVAETNALGGVTTYSQTTNSIGGLMRTTTYPDGGTRIEQYNLDRSLASVTGTAVQPVRYQYGADGGNQYAQEIKLNADGTDSSEWIQSETDPLGRPCKTIYAAPVGYPNPTSFSYYSSIGQLTNSVDPDGVSTLYAYDAKGEQIITAIDMDQNGVIDFGGSDRISWTTNDVVSDHGTFVRRSQTFVWDTMSSATPKLVSSSESSVDGLNAWQTTYRDASAPVVSYSQTAYGTGGARTQTSVAPDGSYTINAYSYGQLMSSTRYDFGGAQIGRITYTYDAHGRQSTVTDARNGATIFGYNNADLAASITTPNPGSGGSPEITSTYYDSSLRATNVVQPDGTSVTSIYYPGGQLEETYGSRTYPVAYTYDYAGRMKTMTTWQNFPSSGAAVTTWNYDPYQGFLTNKAYADGLGPVYSYTPAGRLAGRTWARNDSNGNPIVTSYAYDTAGSLTNVSYSDGATPAVGTTFDRLGRPSTITQDSLVTTQTYNLAGELLTESYAGGVLDALSVSNTYDSYMRRIALTARAGGTSLLTTSYGYDNASRLSSVNDGNNNVATNSYLANSPLMSQLVFKQSSTTRMTTTKQYDYLNRLTQMSSQPAGSGLPQVTFNYNYNAANQRTRDALTDGSYWVYQYDSLGQVTSGHKLFADGTPVPGQQFDYSFDTIGNRTQTKAGGDQTGGNQRVAAYTANNLNQYTSRDYPGTNDVIGAALATNGVTVNGTAAWRKGEYFWATVKTNNTSSPAWLGTTVASGGITNTGHVYLPQTPEQFSYDADGNLTNDGRWAYTWDGENRLIGMTVNTNVGPQYQMTFGYNFQGRRIQKIVATNGVTYATNNFLYDGWNLVAELKPNNSPLRTYVWGTDLSGSQQGAGGVGGLLEVSYYGASTTNAFVAYDGNGNVSALVNAADGTMLANYEYSPFGETIRSTGLMAKNNPFRFSTKYQDDESDQLYYGYRSYNPSTGRWIDRDRVHEDEGGPNLYDFIFNNPISYQDVFGLHAYSISITTKSWIAKPIWPGFVPWGNPIALLNAVAQVSALTSDRVIDDSLDGQYRFLSQKVFSITCNGSDISGSHSSGLFTDVGIEGGFMIPPNAITVFDSYSASSSAIYFSWKVKARPHPLAEPFVFYPVKPRNGHVYIWHEIFGQIKCNCGNPSVSLNLSSSQFPSAAVYYRIDSSLYPRTAFHRQGPMSELWDPSPSDPTLVR